MSTLRPYVELLRPPNVTTALGDVLAGYAVAGRGQPQALPPLLMATMCLYAGGVVLNDVCDVDIDRIERPERPIPSGRVSRRAAATLGAPGWLVFFTVTLPLALPGLLSGAVLAFGRSLGEVGATITFVSSIPGETRTIASGIYALLQTPDGDAEVLRLCAVSVVLSFGSLVVSELLIRAGQRRLVQ